MNRLELIRRGLDLQGKGLEIGPSFSPICPKAEGFDIEIIDVEDRAGLISKYACDKNVGARLNNIEEVDFVWSGGSYVQLIGDAERYDYIIGSHVIEHQVDLLAWLQDLEALLREGGKVALAIPDSRFEFDFFRQPTHIGEVLDTHESPKRVHSYGRYVESMLHTESFLVSTSFPMSYRIAVSRLSRLDQGKFRDILNSWSDAKFMDIHSWVFTPASFALLWYELQLLGLINLSIESLTVLDVPCAEFYVHLRKDTDVSPTCIDGDKLLDLQLALREEHYMREVQGRRDWRFSHNGRIFIYGAGRVGELCQAILADMNVQAPAYIVSKLSENMRQKHCGLPVVEFKDVQLLDEDTVIIAARGCAAMEIRQILLDR